jgi:sec-independent protein translocase protein TatC
LYRHEKRFALPLLLSSIVLFYCGMAFSYFLVFPIVFTFFIEISPTGVSMMTDINQYLDFVMKMFLAFGLAFEIPVATLLMVWSGLTTPDAMAAKRPYIIIGCFVLGMFLTPPDVVSQLLLAIPMWLLFEVGVVLARFVNKTQESETESSGTSD